MYGFVFISLLPMVIGGFYKDQTYFSKRLTGHTIKTIVSERIDVCHSECRLRTDCFSLNYNHYYSLCELNNRIISENSVFGTDLDLHEEQGWISVNVDKDANDVSAGHHSLDLCNVNICSKGQVCRNGICVTDRCEPANNISVAKGVVFGNMNDIGSRIKIVCDVGYSLIGSDVVECLVGGSWSSLPVCEKVCPVPLKLQDAATYPTIVSANINTTGGLLTNINLINGNTAVRDKSEVTFACVGGLYLQSYQTIYCHDGQWIYMPGCKEMGLSIDCVVSVSCSIQPQSNECVNRICRCPLGTSYSYSERRCIEQCPSGYADTFNEVKDVGQWGPNWYNVEDLTVGSKDLCQIECLSRVSYTCRSFDYKSGGCYLQSVTYFDDPPSVYGWSGGAYFLRDCL